MVSSTPRPLPPILRLSFVTILCGSQTGGCGGVKNLCPRWGYRTAISWSFTPYRSHCTDCKAVRCSDSYNSVSCKIYRTCAVKMSGGVEVQLNLFLTLALDGGEWSACPQRPCCPVHKGRDGPVVVVMTRWRREKVILPGMLVPNTISGLQNKNVSKGVE
jgi:hypothetical protein